MVTNYDINTNIRFKQSELVDLDKVINEVKSEWFNQTLCQVNNSVVRLGLLKGEFHWHKHDCDDEFFFVLEGCLLLDVEEKTYELHVNQGYTVPKGVEHRTRAPEKVKVLMISNKEIIPVGDSEKGY